jgi:hypothetical protein
VWYGPADSAAPNEPSLTQRHQTAVQLGTNLQKTTQRKHSILLVKCWMAAEIRMRNGNGRSGDVTCSSRASQPRYLERLKEWYVNLYLQQCNYVIQKRTPDVTFRGLSLNYQMSSGMIRKLNKMLFFNKN